MVRLRILKYWFKLRILKYWFKLRILKYWFKLIQTDNIIRHWVSNVKRLLYAYGLKYVFDHQSVVNVVFLSMCKQGILDCFLQKWYTSKSNSNNTINIY